MIVTVFLGAILLIVYVAVPETPAKSPFPVTVTVFVPALVISVVQLYV